MSRPRMFLSFTTVCSAALMAVRLAVWMFPMQAPAQTRAVEKGFAVVDGPGVVVEPGAKIMHRSPVFYPAGVNTSGTVIVESTVNAKGEVTDARVVSGPDELRNAALSSVLNWHFSMAGGTVQSVIRFEHAANTPAPAMVRAVPPATATSLYLKSINIVGLSEELADKVRASLPVHVGDAFGNEQMTQVQTAIKDVDEHLIFGVRNNPPDTMLTIMLRPEGIRGGITSGIAGGVSAGGVSGGVVGAPGQLIEERGALAQPAADGPPPPQRIRVGGNVQANNLIKKITPMYPPLAKQARIQGTVRFTAVIGKDGLIESLQLIEGHPLLAEAAREAVQQWQYKPTLLNGNPVEVITQIDVNFTLSE